MAQPDNVLSRIEKLYPDLSPSSRQIAHYLQRHPLAIISDSVAEIADKTGTSKASVSRFFRQLGFDSHQQAKQALLALRQSGFPLATHSDDNLSHWQKEQQNIALTFEALPESKIDAVVQLLARSKRVTVIGFRNGYPLALHLGQQLKQIRDNVRLLPQPGQTLSEDLIEIDEDEVIVMFGFRRRTRLFGHIVNRLPAPRTVLITDPTGQIYNQQAHHLLVCHLGQTEAFDSYAAPMSLISHVCNGVYRELGEKGASRAIAISKMYDSLDELEP